MALQILEANFSFFFSFHLPCRLVMDADSIPVVIPFVHTGMHDVMPIGSSIPKIGKRVCTR